MEDRKNRNEKRMWKARAKLTKLEVDVASLPDTAKRSILQREIDLAAEELSKGKPIYALLLWVRLRSKVNRLRFRFLLFPSPSDSNLQLLLKGIVIYSVIVLLFFGPCVVVVNSFLKKELTDLVLFVRWIGLSPLFETVIDLNIQPRAYFWGILGGAGAVVSMVKRFDVIASRKATPWLFFAQGLFNPIVGSLSAVIACRFASSGLLTTALHGTPLMVIAFFAGFSERILTWVGSQADVKVKGQNY
ncbi:hypothetical protein ACFL9T_14555 [Thermodesulfobacteriota bacterium]